ncbi:MAG: ATP-binding protein [candidate division Zixibacteria bacterium]|nr:ATP-binding protein [candidate division Zixibacteria bacterium]
MRKFSIKSSLANLRFRYLLLIVLLLAVLTFLVSSYVIRRNQASLLEVMSAQGESLIEALVLAAENIVASQSLVEETSLDKLRSLSAGLDFWNQSGALTGSQLSQIARASGLSRIDFVAVNGSVVLTSEPSRDLKIYSDSAGVLTKELKDALANGAEESYLPLQESKLLPQGGSLYLQKSRFGNRFILILVTSDPARKSAAEVGIGYLVQEMGRQPGIEFIAMQAPEGIVFASKNIEGLYKIETDPFLQSALSEKKTASRLAKFQGREFLEVVRPFESEQYPKGIFRIGLSLDYYHQTVATFTRQTVAVSVAIFLLGLLLAGFVIVNQHNQALKEALLRTEGLNLSILESMSSAVLAVDAAGKIIILNQVAEKLFGVGKAEIIGKDYSQAFPDDHWQLSKFLDKKGRVTDLEISFRNPEGSEKTLLVSNSGIYASGGRLQGAVSVLHDITDFKSLEEETKKQERLSVLGNLAAGVAHEVRNPLNAISIAAQRLKQEFQPVSNPEEYQSFLKSVLSEIKRLDQIVNQFLTLARAQKINRRPTESVPYLNEIISLVRMEAEQKRINVVQKVDQPATLPLDRDEMKKALLNILLNGIQAMPSGGTLTVEADILPEHKKFRIRISDTGSGISPENLKKIFQPYFSTKETGSGLGLAITQRIVADHGGRIDVNSVIGKGTEFIITLPLA